jgi:hypothetical protein
VHNFTSSLDPGRNILFGNHSFIDFWSCHLRASSLASEVHAL